MSLCFSFLNLDHCLRFIISAYFIFYVSLSAYLPVCNYMRLFVVTSVILSLHMCVYHPMCLFVVKFVFVMLFLFVSLWVCLIFTSFSGYQSVCHLPDVLLLSLSVYCSFCYSESIVDEENDKTDRESSRTIEIINLFLNLSFSLFLSIHVPRLTRSKVQTLQILLHFIHYKVECSTRYATPQSLITISDASAKIVIFQQCLWYQYVSI